jgi:hypothetical protein
MDISLSQPRNPVYLANPQKENLPDQEDGLNIGIGEDICSLGPLHDASSRAIGPGLTYWFHPPVVR